MRVPVVVAMVLNSIMHGVMLVFVSFGMLMCIAFGVGGAILVFASVGFSGWAAGEEQSGESEGCEYVLHWFMVFRLSYRCDLLLAVLAATDMWCLMAYGIRRYSVIGPGVRCALQLIHDGADLR